MGASEGARKGGRQEGDLWKGGREGEREDSAVPSTPKAPSSVTVNTPAARRPRPGPIRERPSPTEVETGQARTGSADALIALECGTRQQSCFVSQQPAQLYSKAQRWPAGGRPWPRGAAWASGGPGSGPLARCHGDSA